MPMPADDGEGEVLGADAEAERRPTKMDAHVLGLLLAQGLGGQHVLDLAGADAEGQGAEGAVGGGVGVAADDRHAGLGEALLGADHVDDALAVGAQGVDVDAELGAVALEGFELHAGELVLDARGDGRVPSVGALWSAMARVRSGRRTFRQARRSPSKACGLVTSWTRWRSM